MFEIPALAFNQLVSAARVVTFDLSLAGGRWTMDAWKMVSGTESGPRWHAEPCSKES
jgi:hypothetical protein